MKEQLLDAWHIHNRMNQLLINNITDEGMQKTLSSRGGRTVFLQLVHVHNVRLGWLEVIDSGLFTRNKKIEAEIEYDRELLEKSLAGSTKGIEDIEFWDRQIPVET